jgi:ankyrin repeat protein
VAIAPLLLDHGADANDFYMAGDAKYSALTGVAGEGEQDAPRQPYAKDLFQLLLERGAEPFDIQVLYNTHFSGDMLWWLELVYEHTVNTARGQTWKDPEWPMFDMGAYGSGARFVLETALKKRNLPLAEWALARGANPNAAPARDTRFPKTTLWQEAMRQGFTEMANLLRRYGASPVPAELSDRENLVPACLRRDRAEVKQLFSRHPEFLHLPDPLFVAAEQDRADVAAFVLDLGVSPDVHNSNNERPLHRAAINNALAVAKLLVESGADVDARESRYHATPLGWASHADHRDMVAFLSRFSRDFQMLCFTGSIDRLRELLAEDSSLAGQVDDEGITPLWWLPDDELKAMDVVEALLKAGADPSMKSKDGRKAADAARRRGLLTVADRLDAPAA